MSNLTSVLNQLQRERDLLKSRIESLGNAISALKGTGVSETSRRISAAGRARMAAGQRARRAKEKGSKVVSIALRKRKLSAAGIAHIRAAQKQRWAKWRKEQKG
jgi:hypothetical protein